MLGRGGCMLVEFLRRALACRRVFRRPENILHILGTRRPLCRRMAPSRIADYLPSQDAKSVSSDRTVRVLYHVTREVVPGASETDASVRGAAPACCIS